MSQYNVQNLEDVNSTMRALIASNRPATATPVAAWMQNFENRIAALNDGVQSIASNRSGSAAPENLRGGIWADTSNSGRVVPKLDPDGLGADDEILTRLEAYRVSLRTGGASNSFKLGGAIDVNTTQVNQTGTGDLMTYAVPANTLNENTQILQVVGFGTLTAGATFENVSYNLGGSTFSILVSSASTTKWMGKHFVIRTGAASQKIAGLWKTNRDDEGTGSGADAVASGTKDFTTALASNYRASSDNGTTTQEIMLTKLLQ